MTRVISDQLRKTDTNTYKTSLNELTVKRWTHVCYIRLTVFKDRVVTLTKIGQKCISATSLGVTRNVMTVGRRWKSVIGQKPSDTDRTHRARFVLSREVAASSNVKSRIDRSRDVRRFRRRRDVIVEGCRSAAERRNEQLSPLSGARSTGTRARRATNSTGSENCIQTSLIGAFEAEVWGFWKFRSAVARRLHRLWTRTRPQPYDGVGTKQSFPSPFFRNYT